MNFLVLFLLFVVFCLFIYIIFITVNAELKIKKIEVYELRLRAVDAFFPGQWFECKGRHYLMISSEYNSEDCRCYDYEKKEIVMVPKTSAGAFVFADIKFR